MERVRIRVTLIATIALIAALAGCATAPKPGTSKAPSTTGTAPSRPSETSPPATGRGAGPTTSAEDAYLTQLYADPRLDPIRAKVPLMLRADAITDRYTNDGSKPTKAERDAIRAWLEVRERAQAYQAEVRGAPPAPLVHLRNQVTQAILQLYSGRLTYGAFAQRVQALDREYRAQVTAVKGAKP